MNKKEMFFIAEQDERYFLRNGLRVLLKKSTFLPLVSIQVWVKVGSINETEDINGVSHFLEHLVFKGTKSYSLKEISKKIERYGAVLNAGTSKEFTVYFVDIPKEGLEEAIKILSELVFDATFPDNELENERNVVIEEIKRYEDTPTNILYENFNKLLFQKSAYKWRVIGKEENIRNLSKSQIIKYYKSFYQPANMIISICGDIEYDKTKELIDKYFNYNLVSPDSDIGVRNPPLYEEIIPAATEIKKHKVQHTYFICGFLGPKIDDKHQYTGEVLSIILGEGLSSRLYQNLREKKQLVYEISSGFYTQVGPSVFYITGVCEHKNFEKTIEEIKKILDDVKNNGVTNAELEKAKHIIVTRWYFNNETVHSKASTLAWWEMFMSLEELNSYLENIGKITNNDIKHFLNLYAKDLVISALMPE
ncbi:MAG: insulinase family protein [Endomicrobia bacterium]|nr:insulinase family protein [Endomicrobiia bacterium]MDW8055545.1 pitrilysin family protein [Elusimicrobiota bacterium]